MNDYLILTVVWCTGLLLGLIFFGGLWWTIRKGVTSEQPALLFLGSLMLRMSIVLVGFYLVAHGQWKRMVLCLLGFISARLIVTALTALSARHPTPARKEIGHAS